MKKIKFDILKISILIVVLFAVASPAFSYTYEIMGHITLEDWLADAQTVNVEVINEATLASFNTTVLSDEDFTITVPAAGSYTVKAKASHWLKRASTGITTKPVGSITINSGAAYATSTSATLTLVGLNYLSSSASSMCFSTDGTTWGDWETYSTSKSWTLSSGDGTKTVYVKFKDSDGKESNAYSDTIVLDTTVPTPGTATCSSYSTSSPITISYSGACDTGGSGLEKVELHYKEGLNGEWEDSGLTSSTASGSFSFTVSGNWGTYYFDLVAEDNAGNRSAVASGYGDCSTIYTYGANACTFSSIIIPPAP